MKRESLLSLEWADIANKWVHFVVMKNAVTSINSIYVNGKLLQAYHSGFRYDKIVKKLNCCAKLKCRKPQGLDSKYVPSGHMVWNALKVHLIFVHYMTTKELRCIHSSTIYMYLSFYFIEDKITYLILCIFAMCPQSNPSYPITYFNMLHVHTCIANNYWLSVAKISFHLQSIFRACLCL